MRFLSIQEFNQIFEKKGVRKASERSIYNSLQEAFNYSLIAWNIEKPEDLLNTIIDRLPMERIVFANDVLCWETFSRDLEYMPVMFDSAEEAKAFLKENFSMWLMDLAIIDKNLEYAFLFCHEKDVHGYGPTGAEILLELVEKDKNKNVS